jgi:uncharacterized protein YdhG (YjbR/CyaY superfamily)
MVQSKAATVDQYLEELPPDQREIVSAIRHIILESLPEGYVEAMNWGMISYEIPLEDYPDTYNGKPLSYLALAAQKNHYSLYMMGVYQDAEQETKLKDGFEQAGKKLDMGKSCLRFRKLDDIPRDVIGDLIASTPPAEMIARHEASRRRK